MPSRDGITVFSTCPQSKDLPADRYLDEVRAVARWSEDAGCKGILVYTDNGIVDPWLVSQEILEATDELAPLVAVQPVYMHPYSVAKMVSSLAFMHGRRLFLNMLAGGFKGDLVALGDQTEHDDRYERTVEYSNIVLDLLRGESPVTVDGRWYQVENLRLTPPVDDTLFPGVLISGSSDAGLAAAGAIGAVPIRYPKPPGEQDDAPEGEHGVRVGIVARDDAEEAWRVALERFPEDRKGQITHRMATTTSDSHWHQQLSGRDGGAQLDEHGEPNPYWLGPFKNYKTFCPYLVGSHDRVARELAEYIRLGSSHFILDIPPSEEELGHIGTVFDRAQTLATG